MKLWTPAARANTHRGHSFHDARWEAAEPDVHGTCPDEMALRSPRCAWEGGRRGLRVAVPADGILNSNAARPLRCRPLARSGSLRLHATLMREPTVAFEIEAREPTAPLALQGEPAQVEPAPGYYYYGASRNPVAHLNESLRSAIAIPETPVTPVVPAQAGPPQKSMLSDHRLSRVN